MPPLRAQGPGNPAGEEAERLEDSMGMESIKETRLSRHNRTDTQKLCSKRRAWASLGQMGPRAEKGRGSKAPFLTQNHLQLVTLHREN